MAKRSFSDDGEKKPITKANLKRFAKIFSFVLPYRWIFILGLFSLVLSSATILSFPYLAGRMLDIAQGNPVPYFDTIAQVAITLLVILAIQSVFSFTRVYTFSIVSERTLADIRQAVYNKIIWLPQKFFDSRRIGELISRITSDVGTLHDTFTFMLAELLRQILVLLIGIPIIFVLTPKLTVFMLLSFPLLVIAALFFGRFIRKLSKKTQDQLASSNIIVEETLQSIAVVKAFTNEWFETRRYKKSLQEAVAIAIHASKFRGLFISFSILSLFGGIVAVSWYGAHLVSIGESSVGDLLSFVFYTTFIGGSIAGLGDIYSQVQRSIGASERILEILQEEDEKDESDHEVTCSGSIAFNNVSFSYPTRKDVVVLNNLSFSTQPGEKIALVGPSGSGKSTIINLLLRLYKVDEGKIIVDGRDANNYPLSAYRHNIGIVPQEVILFGGSIMENIRYGNPKATVDEIIGAARQANALEFIDRFPEGFETVVGDRGVKLSGGQRQRIAIARAILKDPAILVLDEATSSLDAESESLVQDALEALMKNRTTLIIAHRLSTIRNADRILVIKDGQIAESGTHADLTALENGIYGNLLKIQLEIQS